MKSPLPFLSAFLLASIACYSDEPKKITASGVTISIPSTWKAEAVAEPFLHTVGNTERTRSVVVAREPKSESGVANLKEYFDFKLEKIRTTWDAPREGTPQNKQIGGKPAILMEASATIADPKGKKLPAKVYLGTIEGAEYYYLVYATVRVAEGQVASSEVNGVISSLNAP